MGTGGHVDHGKTSLVRALTGVETDRWVEERERGLTIDIGFAPLESGPGSESGIVDVPGHEDFIKNMLAGSTGVDVLLLVVAADEGPMPQTLEHVTIARLLGITAGVIALNKIDRVEDEWLQLVRQTTREEVAAILGHSRWPIVEVSAATGLGLEDLREALRSASAGVDRRDREDLFRMPIDRSFSVRGAGTVVTGTTWSGSLAVGDRVRLLPDDVMARVRSLQVHGEEREEVGPGLRCAMALVGVDASTVDRGSVVVGPGGWRPLSRLGVRFEVPAACGRKLEHGQRVRLFLGTGEVMARVRTVDREPVHPGSSGWGVLDCEQAVVARARDRFVLRFYSPVTTVGGGQVCALEPGRGWRTKLDTWESILGDDPAEAVVAAVDAMSGAGVGEAEIPLLAGVSPVVAGDVLERSTRVTRVAGTWFGRAAADRALNAVVEHLAAAHGVRPRSAAESLESVRAGLSVRFSTDLVDEVVGTLQAEGRVIVAGPGIRLAEHAVRLTDCEAEALSSLRAVLSSAGLSPPPPAELAGRLGVDRELLNDLLNLLLEQDEIVRVTPEIFVTRDSEARARETVRRIASAGATAPGDFREALGLTRKYLIPLLEHMDRAGVTRRTPAGRVLGEPA